MLAERNYETSPSPCLLACLLDDILLNLHHVTSRRQTAVRRQAFSQSMFLLDFPRRKSVLRIVSADKQLEGLGEEDSERPAGLVVGDLLLGGSHALPEELLHPSSARRAQYQRPEN